MLRTSKRHSRLPLDPEAALGNVGNRDRQMAANRNLAEQGLDNADF
jgi:hypothetical protein